MNDFDRKKHWENIYQTKELEEVSWYQPTPQTSLDFIDFYNLPKSAGIIDIGGGDSFLVDHLLDKGYSDLTVLDISAAALQRAQKRLGSRAEKVNWIESDVVKFKPVRQYDFWHDRAAFHFLTKEEDILQYIETANLGLDRWGILLIGTFSKVGPKKCSGIDIMQYSEQGMMDRFHRFFQKDKCKTLDHTTPSEKVQNFIFCSFRKV